MQSNVDTSVVTLESPSNQQQSQINFVANEEYIFPVKRFKIFGGIQIGLGILVSLLCIIGVILDAREHQCSSYDYYTYFRYNYNCRSENNTKIIGFDIACLVCSGWGVYRCVCHGKDYPVGGVWLTMQSYVTTPVVTQPPSSIQQQPHSYMVSNNERVFPARSLKILGGIQIGLGIVVSLPCIIGIILNANSKGYQCSYYYDYYNSSLNYYYCHTTINDLIFAFDITCLICSGWFILTGIIPKCMSQKRQSSWRCLKIAFMVCSIIGAIVFIPTSFALGVTGSLLRADYDDKTLALSVIIAVLSFIEWIVAISSASYCCCCTQWDTTPQQSFIIIGGPQPQVIMMPPQTQIQGGQSQGENTQQFVMTTGTHYQPLQFQNVTPATQNTIVTGTSQDSDGYEYLNPPQYKDY